jgi:hypothetical protein
MVDFVNMNVPTSWHELSQQRLRYVFELITRHSKAFHTTPFQSAEDYSEQMFAMIAITAAFNWNGVGVVCQYGDGWLFKTGNLEFSLTAEDVAAVIEPMNWLRSVPDSPVRLECIGKAAAVAPEIITDLTFENWLACENYWQRYNLEKNDEHLLAIAEILYPDEKRNRFSCSEAELLSVFYWYASAKALISSSFQNFYKNVSAAEGFETQISIDSLRKAVDNQIRALTKGDITKEHEVLQMQAIRALTELDALAHEYEELNRKYNVKK